MELQKKYTLLKATTIALGALTIPWGTFTGFCLGGGRYFTGLVSLCAQTLVALADGYIWFWVLENMRNRIREETAKESARDMTERREVCPLLSDIKGVAAGMPGGTYQFGERERMPLGKTYSETERQGVS